MKKVLYVASEAVPFIKTGGLADVVGSLPKYFPKNEYDVRVVVPKYMCMDRKYTEEMKLVTECQVQLNWRTQYAGVYERKEDGVTMSIILRDRHLMDRFIRMRRNLLIFQKLS